MVRPLAPLLAASLVLMALLLVSCSDDASDPQGLQRLGGQGDTSPEVQSRFDDALAKFGDVMAYQLEIRVVQPDQDDEAGFVRVYASDLHFAYGDYELIAVGGSTFLRIGGSLRELPAGDSPVPESGLAPASFADGLRSLAEEDDVIIVERGAVELDSGTCQEYVILRPDSSNVLSYCLENDDSFARMTISTGEDRLITLHFSYEDLTIEPPENPDPAPDVD